MAAVYEWRVLESALFRIVVEGRIFEGIENQ